MGTPVDGVMRAEPARFFRVSAAEAEPEPAAAYPRHWEADVLLRDGQAAHLRPISGDDEDLLVEFYEQVSAESKYMRFFAPMPRLSARDIERFTHVDHHDRVAFVLTVANKMIAVGRFDKITDGTAAGGTGGPVEAEVAFLVQDAHQGRGIAQLLLEHLAQAGRERGVDKFVAEVLPENSRMIQIFREAGYQVAGGFEDGVMRLEFPISATDTSVNVMQAREHRAEAASIQNFFDARSVAVIGASRRQDTIGQTLVRNLVLGDYQGRVYVVNPAADSVAGMPAYASVADIPGDVDIAIVAVPSDKVADVVLDCAAKGVHGMVVVSSGFAETGEEGRQRQRRLVGLARSYGLRLIGPNCLGIINTATSHSLNASLAPTMPPRGRAGFFCQSGALGVAILEKVGRRGLGLSTFVSAGNRADVSGNDLLQYWEEDDSTEVVLLYLESIGNPRKFSRVARRVSRRKPVIAVKSGRTTQGVPMGHAVRSMAAPQAAVDAMFRQAGVIQVDTLDEMFDVAQLVAHQPLPPRPPRRGGRQLRRARPARSRCRRVRRARGPRAGGARPRRHRRGLRGGAGRRDRRPRRRLGGRGVHPAAEHHRCRGRQRAGRGGGAVRQAAGVDVPRRRGCPRAAPGPRRRRARPPAAARCRPTRRSRPRSGRWPGWSPTPSGAASPRASWSRPRRSTWRGPAAW